MSKRAKKGAGKINKRPKAVTRWAFVLHWQTHDSQLDTNRLFQTLGEARRAFRAQHYRAPLAPASLFTCVRIVPIAKPVPKPPKAGKRRGKKK